MQQFAVLEVPMILLLGLVQYLLVAAKGTFINKTALEVNIADDYITIKTAAFNGPWWFKKESAEIQLNRAEIKVKIAPNPYQKIFKGNNELIKLQYKRKDYYVINGYFNWRLAEELQQKPV